MSAADEIFTDTISMCLQFLRFGNSEFITISTDPQFLRLVFSETITISTLHNFNGRAQRALKKYATISTGLQFLRFKFLQNTTISTFQQFLRFGKYSFVAISTGQQFLRLRFTQSTTISMLCNFDIGSGDKSPQNVNNFNDACNSDTFLTGCVLEGG